MTIDLAQFHSSFFEESFEALDGMEAALLGLDVGAPDPERVNSIFRVAHSIKGGARHFGFKDVASFTHTLETLLDELRSGRMAVTRDISDKLLVSVDVMRAMLTSVQRKEAVDMQKVADLQFDLEMIVAQWTGGGCSVPAPPPAAAAAPALLVRRAARRGRCWPVEHRVPGVARAAAAWQRSDCHFRQPGELGKLTVSANMEAVPRLRSIDAERCYLRWTLELESDCARERMPAFEWAAVDCELRSSRPARPRLMWLRLPLPPVAAGQLPLRLPAQPAAAGGARRQQPAQGAAAAAARLTCRQRAAAQANAARPHRQPSLAAAKREGGPKRGRQGRW